MLNVCYSMYMDVRGYCSSDLYYPAHVVSAPRDDSRLLILGEADVVIDVDRSVGRIILACRGIRPLGAHARSLVEAGLVSSPKVAQEVVSSLRTIGVLRPFRSLGSRPPRAHLVSPISTVVIATANRPRTLKRCLESLAHHCREHGEAPRLLVVDGSPGRTVRAANRSNLATVAARWNHPAEYVGGDEAASLFRQTLEAELPRYLYDFACRPGRVGANRNLGLLLTAGEHILMIDDDVTCDVWSSATPGHALDVTAHTDPADTQFFPSRPAAVGSVRTSDVSLLAAHSSLLGASLQTVLGRFDGSYVLETACSHIADLLQTPDDTLVDVTMSGLVGDAGVHCQYAHLFSTGRTRALMTAQRSIYRLALTSREVVRSTDRYVVTHGSHCMATCMGLANIVVAPPFMPLGRNEDGAFGAVRSFLSPSSFSGYIPYGILHDSHRASAYPPDAMPSASYIRLATVLKWLADTASRHVASARFRDRVEALVSLMTDVAMRDDDAMSSFVAAGLMQRQARKLAATSDIIRQTDKYPRHWRLDAARYRDCLLERMRRPGFFVPIEFRRSGLRSRQCQRLRSFLHSYAATLAAWPALWQLCQSRNLNRDRGVQTNQ